MLGLRVLPIGSAIGLMLCATMNPNVLAAEVVIERLVASDTSFARPHDIHVDPAGRVLIVDPGNNRVQIRDGDLKLIKTLEGPGYDFNEPKYLTVDIDGWLYVADENNNQIKIFDAKYRLQATIGDGRRGTDAGSLNKPEGIEVRGARIWVSDTYNDRILLYRINRR